MLNNEVQVYTYNQMNQPNVEQPNFQQYPNNHQEQKKNKKVLGIIIIIFLALVAISLFIFLGFEFREKSRTVMIYMVGADLESEKGLASSDLEGLDYNKTSAENVNVVLIAGGAKSWDNDYIEEDETSIYKLTENGFVREKAQKKRNMGEKETLTDFLSYVYSNYKADKYDLIFWNHGGAVFGSEYDELYNHDSLELEELKEALNNSPFNGKNKLELVIFSTCLNGTIEVADTFKDYADYLIASEEITLGYAYNSVFKPINEILANDNGYDIGVKFVNGYKDYINSLKKLRKFYSTSDIYSTYSVVDLSKINELEQTLANFINDIDITENYNLISKVRSNLYQYAYTYKSDPIGFYDMIDLYNLVDSLKSLSLEKANEFLKKYEETVLYNYATDPQSRGISVYFPYNGSDSVKDSTLELYKGFEGLQAYRNFISKFYKIQSSSVNTYSFTNNKINFINEDVDADFTLELTEEQKNTFAKASYTVFKDTKDGYFIPIYIDGQATLSGKTLKASIQDRQLKVTTPDLEYTPRLYEIDETDEYIKYKTNVLLENFSSENPKDWLFDNASITLIYDKNTGKTNMGSVIVNSDDEIPKGVIVGLEDYTKIGFVTSKYKILDENGNYQEDWESNDIIEGIEEEIDKVDFELQNFDDEYDYYCIFKIWDTNNDTYYSQLVKMN